MNGGCAVKKKYQILGLFILIICSITYDFYLPEKVNQEKSPLSYVTLEGEFLKEGKYEYEGVKTIQNIVDEVGVTKQANLNALDLQSKLIDESRIYLPPQTQQALSLNQATKEEFMTLKGIGEKMAQKLIDYRNQQPYQRIEDIMNVSGIGEKTYLRLREYLCL